MMALNEFPLKAASKSPMPRLFGMQRLLSQGNSTDGATPGRTFASLHQLPTSATGVRFELANMMTDGSVTYNAAYALSAGANDWFTPLNASGAPDNSLWIPITVGGLSQLTVPPAPSVIQPARLLTDIMPFIDQPPSRVDGGTGICLFFRICAVEGNLTYQVFSGATGLWRGYQNGQNPGQFSQTFGGGWMGYANHCVSGQYDVAFNPHLLFAHSAPYSILPITAMPTLTILSVGDSMLAGGGQGPVDAGIDGPGQRLARAMNRPNRPAFHVDEATSGMTSLDFIGNATLTLSTMVSDIILMQTFSSNDQNSDTKQVAWRAWQRSMTFAAQASALGSTLVFMTSPPFCGTASPRHGRDAEEARVFADSLVRASGLPFIDCDKILGTGCHPVCFEFGYSSDQVHPSEQGVRLLTSAAAELLGTLGFSGGRTTIRAETPGHDGAMVPAHDLFGAGQIVPDGIRPFIVGTHHGTILFADTKTRRLRHGPAITVPHNIFLVVENGLARLMHTGGDSVYFNVRIQPEGPHAAGITRALLTEDGFARRLDMIHHDVTARTFALRGAGLYLCAEGSGDVSLNRGLPGPWETFQAVVENYLTDGSVAKFDIQRNMQLFNVMNSIG